MAQGGLTGAAVFRRDVIIVGGGPAGAAAAISCACAGLDVLVIESARCSKPGETLHPGVEVVLSQLGIAGALNSAGFPRHRGHWVQWDSPARFQAFGSDVEGPWLGYHAMRDAFDEMLLDRARSAGAEIWRPCTALAALLDRDRVSGVVTSRGTVVSHAVIDASGGRHWLARQLKMPLARFSRRLVAAYGYGLGSCPGRDDAPLLQADQNGWTWTARIGPATYTWVRLTLDPGQTWGQVPEEFSTLDPQGRPRGANVTWRMATAPAGPGYVLAGDASAVLDPAASHGVLKALMSGVYAARAVVSVLHSRASSPQALIAYERWITEWFLHDTQRLRSLYQIFPSWPRDSRLCDVNALLGEGGCGQGSGKVVSCGVFAG